MSKTIILSTN